MVAKNVIKNFVVCGPTASGKSAFALQLAQKLGAVIINADSQQIYADLQILSARPTEAEMQSVPHYLYGILAGDEACNAGRWLELVAQLPADKPRIFCGGTGMYLNALFNGIVPLPQIPSEIRKAVRAMSLAEVEGQLADEIPENMRGNSQRLRRALEVRLATGKSLQQWHAEQEKTSQRDNFVVLYNNVEREILRQKIASRMHEMLAHGALDEVRAIATKNYAADLPIMKAHGVPEFLRHLRGEISLEDATNRAILNVQQYAKRQQTWFRNQIDGKIEIAGKSVDEIMALLSSS